MEKQLVATCCGCRLVGEMLKTVKHQTSSFFMSVYRSAQFRHSRLKEGNNLNVTNPIYMPQTMEEEDLEDSRQPLDQPYDFDPEKVSMRFDTKQLREGF